MISPYASFDVPKALEELQNCDLEAQGPMCKLFSDQGSDKGKGKHHWHNYTLVYDKLFSTLRHEELKVFEIGIGLKGPNGRPGASLRAWAQYFPNAQVLGADIDPEILIKEGRISSEWIDQTREDTIVPVCQRHGPFDIILDDGLHRLHGNISLFLASHIFLKQGGYYIVEDLNKNDFSQATAFFQQVCCSGRFQAWFIELPHPQNNFDNRLIVLKKLLAEGSG